MVLIFDTYLNHPATIRNSLFNQILMQLVSIIDDRKLFKEQVPERLQNRNYFEQYLLVDAVSLLLHRYWRAWTFRPAMLPQMIFFIQMH